jgi:putative ABC transport system ATP-binding protein
VSAPVTAGAPALRLIGVEREFTTPAGPVRALGPLDCEIETGELVAIMGPSGSGKSTLLGLCSALDRPTRGRIEVHGRDLGTLTAAELAALRRRTIGYVFQELNLLPSLTASENVMLPLELDGVPTKVARSAAHQALASLSIEALAERFPDELSGGEQQRVAIARAFVGPRTLLLADEPTGALDSLAGETVMRALRAACANGRTAVIVTHDATHAAFADRVVYLRDGKLQTSPPSAWPGPRPRAPGAHA